MLFDVHTHTFKSDCNNPDVDCKSIISTLPTEFSQLLNDNPRMYFSCGIHPWNSVDGYELVDILRKIANNKSVVAIGECGLDRVKGGPIDLQKPIFEQQIEISESVAKPVIIHCVKAWDVLLSVHKDMRPSQSWVIHGFRGKPALANQLINSGMYLSVGSRFNSEAIKQIPIDKMFCETDEDNISIMDIYASISDLLDMSLDQLAARIKENIQTVFSLLV